MDVGVWLCPPTCGGFDMPGYARMSRVVVVVVVAVKAAQVFYSVVKNVFYSVVKNL